MSVGEVFGCSDMFVHSLMNVDTTLAWVFISEC